MEKLVHDAVIAVISSTITVALPWILSRLFKQDNDKKKNKNSTPGR
ncbi:hypothetical protein JIR001_31060 [Polycladomyces abyssicola]|uniref:Uncharacterized protein n=1 Tax=Polycladomyces abyssicola TaxID=1125966 RepID=A0A8D5UIH0_9BACL|nr:hypothetical protein [Polycladomyces abyssicola]BCU83323.1 hypothetical protein JIR001_31060 [Polycladomyces abyssicola]